MREKEAKEVMVLLLVVLSVFLFIAGCKEETCPRNQIMLNGICCYDLNYNFVCDYDEGIAVCSDGTCETEKDENCSSCPQDCGPCKIIKIVYYPHNFSLKNFTTEVNRAFTDSVKFRRDTDAKDEVFNFYFHDAKIPKYNADLMGKKMNTLAFQKLMVISKTDLPQWFLNDSRMILNWANHSRWYYINDQIIEDRRKFALRIDENTAKDEYPKSPTGHDQYNRYDEWIASNYTVKEKVIADNMTLLGNGMVWALHASISDYIINYRYHEYEDLDKDTGEKSFIYAYKNVTEVKMDYINTITFKCARNMAVTLLDYTYDFEHYYIKPDHLKVEINEGRDRLVRRAEQISKMCKYKYSASVFVP
ncbi:TPA: hypothetical protein HA265_02785 [Candidatus Woesearchaeota archaeon]|nr:hypothetical protein [Candidatus Woesearchaeota archaeon]